MYAKQALVALVSISVLVLSGCASGAVTILNLVGLSEKPLIILHVAAPQSEEQQQTVETLIDPFAPYKPLRQALGKKIKRSVVPELSFGFQVEPGLRMGTSHLAVLSPLDYARLNNKDDFPIVAVPLDESGQMARPALLVVKQDATASETSDMVGQRVTFGPVDHPRTHLAALAMLNEAGIQQNQLSLEVLPVPGSLRHRGTAREVARDIVNGATYAGFIDAADWDRLPETSSKEKVGRDQLRVVARTTPVPQRLIIASPKLEPQTIVSIRSFFLNAGEQHPDALTNLRLQGFGPAEPEQVDNWVEVVKPGGNQASASRTSLAAAG